MRIGWIWPTGGVSLGMLCACSLCSKLVYFVVITNAMSQERNVGPQFLNTINRLKLTCLTNKTVSSNGDGGKLNGRINYDS